MGFVARVFSPPKPKAPPKPPPPPKPVADMADTSQQAAMRKKRASTAKLGGAGYGQGSVMTQMEERGTSRTILGS